MISLAQATRELLQAGAGSTCVAYTPFRAGDYAYLQALADVRRRESFATARDRAGALSSSSVPASGAAWTLEGLAGDTYGPADAQALDAFPNLDRRTDDLCALARALTLTCAARAALSAR